MRRTMSCFRTWRPTCRASATPAQPLLVESHCLRKYDPLSDAKFQQGRQLVAIDQPPYHAGEAGRGAVEIDVLRDAAGVGAGVALTGPRSRTTGGVLLPSASMWVRNICVYGDRLFEENTSHRPFGEKLCHEFMSGVLQRIGCAVPPARGTM